MEQLNLRATGKEKDDQAKLLRDIYPKYCKCRHLLFVIQWNKQEALKVKSKQVL